MSYDFNAGNRSLDGTFGSNQNSQGLSLVAWIKCDAASWAAISQQYIVHLKETDNSQDNSIKLTKTAAAANRITAATRDTGDGNAHYNFPATTYDSLWVVVVATFTNDSLRNSYAEASANKGNSTALKSAGALLRFLSIGRSATGFSNLAGLASHVALFNRVLADVEIDALQTGPEAGIAPNTVAPANCIGYWPLTVNQTTHPDESGNGGPTLTVNGAVFTADDPTIGAVGDTPAVNDVPMPDQVVQIGTPYSFDVRPYWSGVPSPVFFDDGLPIGLDISDAGIISGIPQGGFNPPEQPTNRLTAETIGSTFVGYSGNSSKGSLSPVVFNGNIINLISSDSATGNLELRLQGASIPDTDSTFNRFRIEGLFDAANRTILLNRVDATYDTSQPGETAWNWDNIPALINAESYDLFFESLDVVEIHDMTAGNAFNISFGFVRGSYGSIDPDTPYLGLYPINAIFVVSGNTFHFRLGALNVPNTDNIFTQIKLIGDYGAGQETRIMVRSAADAYSGDLSGETDWRWDTFGGDFIDGNIYVVELKQGI